MHMKSCSDKICASWNCVFSSNIRLKHFKCRSLCFQNVVQCHWMRGALLFKTMWWSHLQLSDGPLEVGLLNA